MSGLNFKPGDVAMVENEFGVWNRAILQVHPTGRRWVYGVAHDSVPADGARALAVAAIDPGDVEAVDRLTDLFNLALRGLSDECERPWHAMRDALYGFANSTKPEEPTGKFAEVINAEGMTYYRTPGGAWRRSSDDLERPWSHIDATHVLSEGVA